MQSKAYLLLERDHIQLQEAGFFGISACPVKEDLSEWVATVQGLKDSLWEGAALQLSLKYTADYNSVPPTVTFNTIPFHPNVDAITGKPCVDFLDNPRKWEEHFSLTTILLTIQVMLSNPVLENPINVEAAKMLMENPPRYREMVLECVRASRQLKATGVNFTVECLPVAHFQNQAYSKLQRIKMIAFDEYHKTWTEIATSKPNESCKDSTPVPCVKLQALYYGFGEEELQKEVEAQNKEFGEIIYGTSGKERKTQTTMNQKLERINRMKNSYIMNKFSEASTSVSPDLTTNIKAKQPNTCAQEEDLWTKEVDSLVNWTTALNADELEDD
ncbi:ubiquitin-conjugating enzyme E2 U-like isoform X2 [Pristis pectinata]|uniref:ubiquitin-conjugating enzyme E2 U-like isoform X2 n=1 Tax=Pristis pectinata TaxID=685728 RepID=UPI00223D4CCB|nr:ubiquitin-conjugating enzyme E2 U-like isoform X2 [Pristis pectinata]